MRARGTLVVVDAQLVGARRLVRHEAGRTSRDAQPRRRRVSGLVETGRVERRVDEHGRIGASFARRDKIGRRAAVARRMALVVAAGAQHGRWRRSAAATADAAASQIYLLVDVERLEASVYDRHVVVATAEAVVGGLERTRVVVAQIQVARLDRVDLHAVLDVQAGCV